MKKSKVLRDTESFYVDTYARRLRSDEVGTIEALAGEHFFNIRCESVSTATNRDELRPDLEKITASLGVLSPGERVFVLSLYQFFSDSTV